MGCGAQSVPASGVILMPVLCADNWAMILKVKHVSTEFLRVCGVHVHMRSIVFTSDGRSTDVFGPGAGGLVFLSEVNCAGGETSLTLCSSSGLSQQRVICNNPAGVTCGKSSTKIVYIPKAAMEFAMISCTTHHTLYSFN